MYERGDSISEIATAMDVHPNTVYNEIKRGDLSTPVPSGTQAIITNPPFSAAEGFIRRSLENGLPFALLLKSQYWHAASRRALFYQSPPSLVLPITWRPDFTGQGASLMDVAWSVWLTPNMKSRTEYIPLERPTVDPTH